MRFRWGVVCFVSLMHPVLLYLLYPVFGEESNLILPLAPIVASLLIHWWAGILFTVINALFTVLVFRDLFGMAQESRTRGLILALVTIALCYLADRLGRFVEERRSMAEELRQAKKMEAIGLLAGGVAHDMNNTLNAIMGSVFAHRQELAQYGRHFPDLDNIVAACDRGAELTRNLLGFARKSNYRQQTFSLNGVVEEVQAILGRTANKNIRIETHLAEGHPLVDGDRGQTENAVMNLCLNALDAMVNQGTLTLTTAKKRSGAVSISVADTGTGMNARVRERVFEPFFTTKEAGKGTGLGLSMVYGVVRTMNGKIDIDSAPGKGTEVTLSFPKTSFDEPNTGLISVPSMGSDGSDFLRGRTVLMIDDEPLVLRAGVRMLRSVGCEVLSARSGAEGIELFKLKKEGISFAIVDLIMPDMDGIATVEAILEIEEKTPVLLVSGYTRESEKMEALRKRSTTVRFLSKPYQPDQLVKAARNVMGPRGRSGPKEGRSSSA